VGGSYSKCVAAAPTTTTPRSTLASRLSYTTVTTDEQRNAYWGAPRPIAYGSGMLVLAVLVLRGLSY
jgi:hypothetical protein